VSGRGPDRTGCRPALQDTFREATPTVGTSFAVYYSYASDRYISEGHNRWADCDEFDIELSSRGSLLWSSTREDVEEDVPILLFHVLLHFGFFRIVHVRSFILYLVLYNQNWCICE
jgi:hypothetical protein